MLLLIKEIFYHLLIILLYLIVINIHLLSVILFNYYYRKKRVLNINWKPYTQMFSRNRNLHEKKIDLYIREKKIESYDD